jgi:F-type H+-transporting ATPase subunit alpha
MKQINETGELSDEDLEKLGEAIGEMVDDFGPDFDEEGQPLEEGESDRVKSEDEHERPGRTDEEAETEREAEADAEKAEKTVEKAEEEVAA